MEKLASEMMGENVTVFCNNVSIFTVKQGLFKNSFGDLLAKHPRGEVKAMKIESGMMSTVHIVLQNGTHYVLLCTKVNQKRPWQGQGIIVPAIKHMFCASGFYRGNCLN